LKEVTFAIDDWGDCKLPLVVDSMELHLRSSLLGSAVVVEREQLHSGLVELENEPPRNKLRHHHP